MALSEVQRAAFKESCLFDAAVLLERQRALESPRLGRARRIAAEPRSALGPRGVSDGLVLRPLLTGS
jgi:hypothetical protein